MPVRPASIVALFAIGACTTNPSPRERFDDDVLPLLEARCSAPGVCHGVARGSEAAGDVVDWGRLFFETDDVGTILDVDAAYAASKRVIDPSEPPAFSSLVRKPMPAAFGGTPHQGGSNFTSLDDAAYARLADWIISEPEGGETVAPLTELERRFAEQVQPVLQSASCLNASCHGVDAAVPYRLDPGIDGHFSVAASRANYEMSRTMLALDGDPRQSRLLVKGLPLHAGGIPHKGGNDAFFRPRGDPRVDAILEWACAEREDQIGARCTDDDAATISGFVFVKGPTRAEDAFVLDQFAPGTDIWFTKLDAELKPTETTPLTRALHDGTADARDPAIDPTGRKMAFALRRDPDSGHELWEMDLATGEARQLTTDAGSMPGGGLRTDREPTYGPHGHIWFVSTRAGNLADDGARLDADLYELKPKTGEVVRRTWTPHIERRPVFFVLGEENGGEVAFTALRAAVPAQRRAPPVRVPPDLATEYHQHFGITPAEDFFDDVRELPDGRYAMIVGDLGNRWPTGRLGIIDRNFGPELPPHASVLEPGLPGYAPPLIRLDPATAATGTTAGTYRDPAPIPDGRILVARAPQTFDLRDPTATPKFQIELLTLAHNPQSGLHIDERTTLAEDAALSVFDPQPVLARQPPHTAHEDKWDPTASDGLFVHNGVAVIDAVLANLPPSGIKDSRDDFRFIRIVESLPFAPNDRQPVATSTGATTTSLSPFGPARILAELPLAGDGTFQLRMPAGVPFRLQGLDKDRMSIGQMHNRWYYVAPGQKLVQGTGLAAYDKRCAPCHGASDGDPKHAFVTPDTVTAASITLSRYEDRNPRRPLPPTVVGDETRVEVDFLRDVQPILTEACSSAGCHAGSTPAGGLDLGAEPTTHFNRAYESLLSGDYVDVATGRAAGSALLETILGRELDAPRPLSPHPELLLSEADQLTLIRWIELGASFAGMPAGSSR